MHCPGWQSVTCRAAGFALSILLSWNELKGSDKGDIGVAEAYWIRGRLGLILVGASIACVNYAFREANGPEFWHAVFQSPGTVRRRGVAVATVRGGTVGQYSRRSGRR